MQTPLWLERATAELGELGNLFVVDRRHQALYEYLREHLAAHPAEVVLDRRSVVPDGAETSAAADRPAPGGTPVLRTPPERRQLSVEDALRSRGFAVIQSQAPSATGSEL